MNVITRNKKVIVISTILLVCKVCVVSYYVQHRNADHSVSQETQLAMQKNVRESFDSPVEKMRFDKDLTQGKATDADLSTQEQVMPREVVVDDSDQKSNNMENPSVSQEPRADVQNSAVVVQQGPGVHVSSVVQGGVSDTDDDTHRRSAVVVQQGPGVHISDISQNGSEEDFDESDSVVIVQQSGAEVVINGQVVVSGQNDEYTDFQKGVMRKSKNHPREFVIDLPPLNQ